jgi:hypothetical protein
MSSEQHKAPHEYVYPCPTCTTVVTEQPMSERLVEAVARVTNHQNGEAPEGGPSAASSPPEANRGLNSARGASDGPRTARRVR